MVTLSLSCLPVKQILDLSQNPLEFRKLPGGAKIACFLVVRGSHSYLETQKTARLPSGEVVGREGFGRGLLMQLRDQAVNWQQHGSYQESNHYT